MLILRSAMSYKDNKWTVKLIRKNSIRIISGGLSTYSLGSYQHPVYQVMSFTKDII